MLLRTLLAATAGLLARLPPTSRTFQRLAQEKLDLSVEAAQIVIGPSLHLFEDAVVNPKQEGFTFSHVSSL